MNNKVLASVEKNNSIYTTTKNWIIAWSLLFAICTYPAMKKYYPQYAEYFWTTFEVIRWTPQDIKSSLNIIIEENFEIFGDDIITEKDKITTILMFYEIYLWNSYFVNQNDVKVISKELGYDIRYSAAKEISSWFVKKFGKEYQEAQKINLEITNEKKAQNRKWKEWDITPEIMKWDIEKILTIWMKLFDKNLLDWTDMKRVKTIVKEIEDYIEVCKISWKKPSSIGQKFIDEYNKIK